MMRRTLGACIPSGGNEAAFDPALCLSSRIGADLERGEAIREERAGTARVLPMPIVPLGDAEGRTRAPKIESC